jgi:hypothetical protein
MPPDTWLFGDVLTSFFSGLEGVEAQGAVIGCLMA